MNNKFGQLSKYDIINEIDHNELKILSIKNGIKNERIKELVRYASFDITPSIVALSAKTGMLETVYKSKNMIINSYYICVKPKDTVLIVSNEYLCIPGNITGYVTSRVSNVVKGFGHISTTVDPTWNGALLIALSNPSNQTLKIDVGIPTKADSKKRLEIVDIQQTLATVTFHYLNTAYTEKPIEYKSMRLDLLKQMQYKNKKGIKAFFRKIYLHKRCRFTDYFFEYLEANEDSLSKKNGWEHFLNEFSIVYFDNKDNSDNKKMHSYNFVIKENIFNRLKHFYLNYKHQIYITIFIITVITLVTLFKLDILDKEIVVKILDLLD